MVRTIVVALLLLAAGQNRTAQQKNNLDSTNSKKLKTMENQNAKTGIEKSLGIYFDALNSSSAESAVGQYTADGIFMPSGLPSATGTSELQAAYEDIFKAIQLHVTFKIEEVVELNDSLAFVRTQSNGTQLVRASGRQTEELNREFFLMSNENGNWKIARYMFNQPK